jgi:hypothetical protein
MMSAASTPAPAATTSPSASAAAGVTTAILLREPAGSIAVFCLTHPLLQVRAQRPRRLIKFLISCDINDLLVMMPAQLAKPTPIRVRMCPWLALANQFRPGNGCIRLPRRQIEQG